MMLNDQLDMREKKVKDY